MRTSVVIRSTFFALVGVLMGASVSSLVGCAHHQDGQKEKAQLHLEMGTSLMAQGNYPGALSELLKAEQLDDKNPDIENNLGLAYMVRGRTKEADQHFKKALELKPTYSDARANLGRLQIDLGQYDEALKNLQIVENDLTYPNPEKPLSLIGSLYFKEGKFKRAETYLARSMAARRDSCVTSDLYGRTLMEEKKWDEAAHMLDLAVDNCRPSRFEEPLFYSAMTYYSLGNHDKSKARLQELIKNYPDSQFYKKAQGMMALME